MDTSGIAAADSACARASLNLPVFYQQQGEVDIIALRRVILANLENETYVGHPNYWASK